MLLKKITSLCRRLFVVVVDVVVANVFIHKTVKGIGAAICGRITYALHHSSYKRELVSIVAIYFLVWYLPPHAVRPYSQHG